MPDYFDPALRPNDDARSGIAQNDQGQTIVPLEAVIADKDSKKMQAQAEFAEQVIEERVKRAKEPVRMEGLKPLPRGMAAPGAGVIPGGPDALGSPPGMRRTIPPPFSRPRISIEHHGKTWGYARADLVEAGDIVVDFGLIAQTVSVVLYERVAGVQAAVGTEVRLVNLLEEMRQFSPDEQLRVFRVHDSDD